MVRDCVGAPSDAVAPVQRSGSCRRARPYGTGAPGAHRRIVTIRINIVYLSGIVKCPSCVSALEALSTYGWECSHRVEVGGLHLALRLRGQGRTRDLLLAVTAR